MTRLAIRKSGGANIISIPRAVLKSLGLHTGSIVDLALDHNRIILTPANDELILDALLKGSPKERLVLEEDKEWIDMKPVGKEN